MGKSKQWSIFSIYSLLFRLMTVGQCGGAFLVQNSPNLGSQISMCRQKNSIMQSRPCDNFNDNKMRYSTVRREEPEMYDLGRSAAGWGEQLNIQPLALLVVVTGIPLLLTLAALIMTESHGIPPKRILDGSDIHLNHDIIAKDIKNIKAEQRKDFPDATNKVAFTKDIFRVASQSLNLASNTLDLFNTLRGVGDNSDGDSGDGGGEVGIAASSQIGILSLNEKRSSGIRFLSKLLQLSTTTLMFILQILNY